MASMFYSLQEAAEKLNKSEQEVRKLAKQGKLREFRDGSHLLFKVDEVEALMADTSIMASEETSALVEQLTEPVGAAELEQAPEPEQPPELEEAEVPGPPAEPVGAAELEQVPEPEQPPELEEAEAPGPPAEPEHTTEEDISLAPETGLPSAESDSASADTALTGEGINVLGETDRDYQVTDDTMAETVETVGPTGTTDEASLEEIEEDVNLDTFGSGSGLLDLSLQADDTSLGGILDEIYTTEGGEEGQEPTPGSAVGMAAEAEEMLPEGEPVGPQLAPEVPAAQMYIEPKPDVASDTFGMLLFLPLSALIYTAVVAIAAQRGVMPSVLQKIQGAIWYIVIGAIVVAGLIVGSAFALSGDLTAGLKKQKKARKPKKSKKAKKTSPSAPEETAV